MEAELAAAIAKERRAILKLWFEIILGSALLAAVALLGYHLRDKPFPAPVWVAFIIPFAAFALLNLKSLYRLSVLSLSSKYR